MKLRIRREQGKTMLGGINFESTIKIEMSPEEVELIRRYKAHKETIWSREWIVLGQKLEFKVTVGDLLDGRTFKSRNLLEHVELESALLDACRNLKVGANVMATIGQEQVYEI